MFICGFDFRINLVRLAIFAISIAPGSAAADTPSWIDPPANYDAAWGALDEGDWTAASTLTGGWGGRRDEIEKRYGLDVFGGYQMESAGNPIGGRVQGVTYTHDVSLAVSANLDTIAGLRDTYFLVSISDRAGASLSSSYIGNTLPVQELFVGQTFRLAQLAVGTGFLDGRLDLVAGRINALDDFASSPLYCFSQNGGICGNPESLTMNVSLSNYPTSSWGARALYLPHDAVEILVGAYNAFRNYGANGYHGVDFSIRHNSGVIGIGEVALLPDKLGEPWLSLPGHYKIGGYYDNEPLPNLRTGDSQRGTWGIYAAADQQLTGEAGGNGLSAFIVGYYGPPDVNLFEWFANWGLIYQGVVPGRPNDALGLLGAYGSFSSYLPQSYEIVLELNYTWAIFPWLSVQPDIQGVINPAGAGDIDDALVLALQITVPF